jgi:hypothetical protein
MAELKFKHKITADQLRVILNDFSFMVDEGDYEKLMYQTWRALQRMRGDLQVYWFYPSSLRTAEIDICEIEGVAPQKVHLSADDGSFGEFFYEELLTYIEDYDRYNPSKEPLMVLNPNEGVIAVAPHQACEVINTTDRIEDAWRNELATKADASCFEQVSDTVQKLCESARLAAPINNNHTNNKENNVMNFNFDFGPVNPSLVRMSMYGLAVKNKAGTWVSFNASAGEIMDVDILNFDGAKFLYRVPVAIKDIAVGDVVIHNSAPMFVVAIPDGGKVLTVIDTINGERKDIMLPRSPFGFNFATKVMNFLGNMFNTSATAENPFGNMWMLMAMSGDNKDMDDMLPFLMMNNANSGMDNNMLMCMLLSRTKGNADLLPWVLMSQSMNATPAHICKCGGNCGENHTQN